MKKIIIIALLLFGFSNVFAQYTKIINSKRPGFSESPYGVGTKVFQAEAGAFYQESIDLDDSFEDRNAFGSNLFLRYSNFLEKLEINLDTRYQKDKINSNSISGISRLTLGAKYLVYNATYKDKSKEIRSWKKRHAFDWSRLIPSVGVYAGWNSNFISEDYQAEGMSIKGAVLLQNDINERFVVLTNLIVDDIMLDNMTYSYILTSTLALNNKWSIFGEHQGVFNEVRDTEYQFGAGTAYLYTDDIQLDVAVRTSLINNDFSNYYVSLGGSWRLDRHEGKLKSTNALEGTKEPFFKRIFKKKRRKKPKLKGIKAKKRKKKGKKSIRSRKAKKGTPSFFNKGKGKKKKKRRKSNKD